MRGSQIVESLLLVVVLPGVLLAQQQTAPVVFGGLRVPPCVVATDPDYGHVAAKPIQLGGGPSTAAARMSRFIGALRGPQGEILQLAPTRGSGFAAVGYWDEPTILDYYTVQFAGQSMPLVVDTYHYSLPQAPSGLTCSGPLVTALGMPPLDPMKNTSSIIALAIERGSAKEVPPVPLDIGTARGFLFDQFTILARRARAAAQAGTPLDPPSGPRQPADFEGAGWLVLAQPVACGARIIPPQGIELQLNQMPIPRNGDFIRGDAVALRFHGFPVPADSIAAVFRQSTISHVKITYAESCEGASPDVLLPIAVEPPRIMARPGVLPAGNTEPDTTVYLQVLLDEDGRFARPLHIGGPKSLVPAAIETINGWITSPLRLNRTAIINPVILQVVFR